MSVDLSTNAVALVDANPASLTVLELARRSKFAVTIMASVDTKLVNAEMADSGTQVVRSLSAEPKMREVLELAAERRCPWVILRRDAAPPQTLVSELIVGAGKADPKSVPGFGVLLLNTEQQVLRRGLVVIDKTHGPASGLTLYMAVRFAESARAPIDILVVSGPGEDASSEDEFDALEVNREEQYLTAAQELAQADGVELTWITATGVSDVNELVFAQLKREDYNLVIDDIGDLVIGGLRRGISPDEAVLPGQVGELPMRLLAETDVNVLLVIDEIRMGMMTSRRVKLTAAAAAALALMSGGAIAVGRGALPTDSGETVAASATATTSATALVAELEATSVEVAAAQKRAGQASSASRSSTKTAAPPEVKAPSGGASASQVSKAEKAEATAKAEYDDAKAALAKAEDKAAKEAADLEAAQAELERAQLEITKAQEAAEEALLAAEKTASEGSGLAGMLPNAPDQEDVATAEQSAQDAQEWLAGSVERGEAALDEVAAAQKAATSADKSLAKAQTAAAEAKVDYQAAKEKTDVYQESLAESKTLPVKEGQFNYTATYGQAGSAWSKGYHTGLDFAAPTGTNVYAAASGTVVSAGYDGAYGNRVVIKHPDGYYSTYNHLSNIDVSVGDKVTTGEKIGDVGNTGNSFGSHLHFEVTKGGDGWSSGSFVNPATWLKS